MNNLVKASTVLVVLAALVLPTGSHAQIAGIDHIPIAVNEVEAAGRLYSELGFTLKTGRPHPNGIRNLHIKFRDGTELELISVDSTTDDLTREYSRFLHSGDGPAFVALYTKHPDSLSAALSEAGFEHTLARGLLTFPETHPLRYIFFGPRNASPTDRPEHFQHENTAESLIGVWLAPSDLRILSRLIGAVGLPGPPAVAAPDTVWMPDGFIRIVDSESQIVTNRPIIGATIRVRDLDAARRAIESRHPRLPILEGKDGARGFLLPPEATSGLWLHFVE